MQISDAYDSSCVVEDESFLFQLGGSFIRCDIAFSYSKFCD